MRRAVAWPLVLVAVLAGAVTAGCTPEKARAIRAAAVQFKVDSLAAIDGIDELRRMELAPPARSSAEATEEFATRILTFTGELTENVVRLAIDPYTVQLDPAVQAEWVAFIDGLRRQYATFASIFDEVERGSFFARKAIAESAGHANTLALQMTALAEAIDRHPPVFIQQRTAVVAKIEQVRKSPASESEKRQRLAELKEQLEGVYEDEQELRRQTVERCVKAAVLGHGLQEMIGGFDRLSVEELSALIAGVLDTAGGLTGSDYGQLKSRSTALLAQIQQDPALLSAFDQISIRVTTAVKDRLPPR